MEGYLQRESNLLDIHDQESIEALGIEINSHSLSDWCNWGFIRPEKFESSNIHGDKYAKPTEDEYMFDIATLSAQVSKGPVVYNGKGSNSRDYGEYSVGYSSRIVKASDDGQPECQLQSSMNWMDEILRNSLIQQDNGSMQETLQTFNIPDSISRSQSFENLLSDMLTDAQSLTRDMNITEVSEPSSTIQQHTNYKRESLGKIEDSSTSCLMLEEYKRSEVSTTDPHSTAIKLNASNKNVAVASVDESACWEASTLVELEGILIHLDENMRVCFRDSFYRLANNSNNQQVINHQRSINTSSFIEVNSESTSLEGSLHGESRTNVVDRTIANLIFNGHYFHAPAVPCTGYRQPPASYYST